MKSLYDEKSDNEMNEIYKIPIKQIWNLIDQLTSESEQNKSYCIAASQKQLSSDVLYQIVSGSGYMETNHKACLFIPKNTQKLWKEKQKIPLQFNGNT